MSWQKKRAWQRYCCHECKKSEKKGLFSIFKPQQVEVTVALEEEENRISAKRLRRSVRSPDRVKRRETPGARKRNRNSRQSRERQSGTTAGETETTGETEAA